MAAGTAWSSALCSLAPGGLRWRSSCGTCRRPGAGAAHSSAPSSRPPQHFQSLLGSQRSLHGQASCRTAPGRSGSGRGCVVAHSARSLTQHAAPTGACPPSSRKEQESEPLCKPTGLIRSAGGHRACWAGFAFSAAATAALSATRCVPCGSRKAGDLGNAGDSRQGSEG